MKISIVLTASAVSAHMVVPRDAPNMPASAFPKFEVITLDQAKQGLDRDIQNLPPKPVSNLTASVDTSVKSSLKISAAVSVKATTAASRACAASPNYRFEWRNFSAGRRLSFVTACQCLLNRAPSGRFSQSRNRYEDFVALHQNVMTQVHNNALFLIWHRYFLWTFEQVLRTECGYSRAMMWWDETLDAGNFANSDIFTNPNLFGNLPGLLNGNPQCISTGAFRGVTAHIGPGTTQTNHCLSRGVTETNTAQCNAAFINYCQARTAYPDFETCLEYGPHGYGHNGIGGVMQDVWSSPSDPIFWVHHAFIDHAFAAWQALDPSRTTTISGVDSTGRALTLDYVISMGGIRPDVKIRDILDPMGGVNIGGTAFCYKYA
ncbi:hypothetical protein BKA67DRAFT_260784 [Truncatella angustata]|uniref:Tyrosinase copper-binding domain-containing protein n=1 Tax=Truncatella angustata TaxID=152316 RepID=A0A9P8ZWJ6_9PEZI|nr:uncharacterized protein BKA67DRAFT_260784 [Truncatella angustata]KAH6653792.1 hypothetical protein BKA67DRAFT_260784 [Truncatella angustata]KAH8194515.1 hypothetical protein TruAng_011314 [Truncatella angustata]